MASGYKALKRVLVILYLAVVHGALIYLAAEKISREYVTLEPVTNTAVSEPLEATPMPTPEQEPTPAAVGSPTAVSPVPALPSPTSLPAGQLLIPVAGVRPDQLIDSFSDARSEGRVHDAIDIAAPAGTPVLAAADGKIVKFFESEKGGITIYQLSADGRFVYYYAHLQRRADDLQVGDPVQQGRTIGYVGDTGNAGPGNWHLHFSITAVSDAKRYWEGVEINPFPYLKSGMPPQ